MPPARTEDPAERKARPAGGQRSLFPDCRYRSGEPDDDLPVQIPRPVPGVDSTRTLAEIEKTAILKALEANDGDRRRTAEQLDISLRTLQYRLKEYGLTGRD
ncbi:MAG: hypothetical protein EHM61_08635 [Acidobacteria bacterium]|nr:MAG: hypothetical protein EHM61_08635 [Acidobacteriota bacterium]